MRSVCHLPRIENAINDIMAKLDLLDHHLEHELAAVNDHINSLLGKIEKREDKSELRIDSIEAVRKLCIALL